MAGPVISTGRSDGSVGGHGDGGMPPEPAGPRRPGVIEVTLSENLTRGATSGAAVAVRTGHVLRQLPGRRIVVEGDWGGRHVVLKRFLPGPRQARDAAAEWAAAKRLQHLGLTVPEPLFSGTAPGSEKVVALGFVDGGIPLTEHLATAAGAGEHRDVFTCLLREVAAQHAAGVYQRDHHLGNYLWDPRAGRPVALDAGSFAFTAGGALGERRRRADLALLFANVDLPAEPDLWAAFDAYAQSLAPGAADRLQRALPEAVGTARRRRVKRYIKKVRRSSTAIGRRESRGRLLLFDRTLPGPVREAFEHDPDGLVARGQILKDGNTSTVATAAVGGGSYVIKRYNRKPLGYRLRHAPLRSRALNSWCCGLAWHLLGLATARPLACLETRCGGLLERAYLLMEQVEGVPLYGHASGVPADDLASLAARAGAVWRALGQLRAVHGDLKATNFIVPPGDGAPGSPPPPLRLIDFDATRLCLPAPLFGAGRERDRRRFMANWRGDPRAAAAFHETVGKA